MEGKVIGKLVEEERQQFLSFEARHKTIDVMFRRCINEQQQLEHEINLAFEEVRKNHNITEDVKHFTVVHATGEIYEITESEQG